MRRYLDPPQMQRESEGVTKKTKGEKDAVKVMVRVRPFSTKELNNEPRDRGSDYPTSVVSMDGDRVDVIGADGTVKESCEFHKTFWSVPVEQQQHHVNEPYSSQSDVFAITGEPAVQSALKGYHTCIFAYGQTGSGKTHTMLGSQSDPGVAPNLIHKLFAELEAAKQAQQQQSRRTGGSVKYTVEISFMEIYNENVKDLFGDEFLASKGITMGEDGLDVPTQKELIKRRKSTLKDAEDAGPSPMSLNKRKSLRGSAAFRDAISPRGGGGLGGRRATVNLSGPGARGAADDEAGGYKALKVRQSPAIGTFVEGLKRIGPEQGVTTAADVEKMMHIGMSHRSTAATQMNDTSSRSHAIFQICLKSRAGASGTQRYAHINLVDLAGSERVKMSGVEGDRFTEATRINLSLSTLRRVIDALIENTKLKKGQAKVVPPYRDSMLTWILSESLGGNSKTMMIATVSPAESNRDDTVNTLRYALKAKSIVNTVRVNEQQVSVVVSAMMREMQELRERLEEEEGQNECDDMKQELGALEDEYNQMEVETRVMKQTDERIKQELEAHTQVRQEKEEEVHRLQKEERVEEKHVAELEKHGEVTQQMREAQEIVEQHQAEQFRKEMELQNQALEKEAIAKKNYEVAYREEAFRKEMLVVKRKQFALAFNKAFKQTKATSTLETSLQELHRLNALVNQASIEAEQMASLRKNLDLENMQLESATRSSGVEYEETRLLRTSSEETTQAVFRAMQAEKKRLDEEVLQLKTQHSLAQNSLYLEEEMAAKERHVNQERTRHSTLRATSVKSELATKRRLSAQLAQQAVVCEEENAHLRGAGGKARTQNTRGAKATAALSREATVLRAANQRLNDELGGLYARTAALSEETTAMNINMQGLEQHLEEVSGDHEDLRHFVACRFFPNSNGEPPVPRAAVPLPKQLRTESPFFTRSSTHTSQTPRGDGPPRQNMTAFGGTTPRFHSQTPRGMSSTGLGPAAPSGAGASGGGTAFQRELSQQPTPRGGSGDATPRLGGGRQAPSLSPRGQPGLPTKRRAASKRAFGRSVTHSTVVP